MVCTPGRMIDILCMQSGKLVNLKRVTMVVLDEADRCVTVTMTMTAVFSIFTLHCVILCHVMLCRAVCVHNYHPSAHPPLSLLSFDGMLCLSARLFARC